MVVQCRCLPMKERDKRDERVVRVRESDEVTVREMGFGRMGGCEIGAMKNPMWVGHRKISQEKY